MINFILQLALIFIAISMLILIYRVIKGPSIPDRIVALDAISMNLICMIALFSLLLNTSMFLEVILLISILSFTGTVAFSKFLEKGEIIENERD